MKWWNRLSYRLTVFVLLLAIVPLAGFGISTIQDIRNVRLKSIAQIHKGVVEHSANQIELYLLDTIKEIQLVIDSNELDSLDAEDQEWLLQLLIQANPYLYSLAIADNSGQERVKVGRDTVYNPKDLELHTDHPDFLTPPSRDPIIGTIHAASAHRSILDVYIPLFNPMERVVTAVLAVEIDIRKLLGFTADLRIGQTGYVYIVDKSGQILVYPDNSVVLAGKKALENPLVKEFVSGKKVVGTNGHYTNRNQVEVLTNARAVNEPKLLVVVAQSVEESLSTVTRVSNRQSILLVSVLIVAMFLSLYFTGRLNRPLRRLESGAERIGSGDLAHRIPVASLDELGTVTQSFNAMARDLEEVRNTSDQQDWLKQGAVELDQQLRGDLDLEEICMKTITFMAHYLDKQVGLMYVHDGGGTYEVAAGFAVQPKDGLPGGFRLGQGLPGQAAMERKILHIADIPAGYISITSGLGSMVPKHLSIVPFVYNDQVEAVMELGSFRELTALQQQFLAETQDTLAIIIAASRSRKKLLQALEQTRQQAHELTQQQEELQAANEEMEEQTQLLMASESKLKEQQEELQAANEELEEKTDYLERNKKNIEEKNRALEQLRTDLEKKADDLAAASKYKSEFLANMSHELRTPLNSMLLLARLMSDNREKNLTSEQVESATIIYNSGHDLLLLINEILDLSKIEAGRMELSLKEISLAGLKDEIDRDFRGLADEKGLALEITLRETAPAVIVNDHQRVVQVLKNFIANAIKFTAQGGVSVDIYQPDAATSFNRSDLTPENTVAVAVRDTGIGIPQEKQTIIFEAFQQLEGGSARKYGGTGLGLSISRELANLLGGEIQLTSLENEGSVFTLFLPTQAAASSAPVPLPPLGLTTTPMPELIDPVVLADVRSGQPLANPLDDDRDHIGPDDKAMLIIEDDKDFAAILLKFCRSKGFKVLVALTGEQGLALVETYLFKAIILDINLPGIDGWTVLENLKDNPATRHIPVHFMSADDPVPEAFRKGAIGYLTKPVTFEDLESAMEDIESLINKEMKDLLLVEDDENQQIAIIRLINDSDVDIRQAFTGGEAIAALREKQYDCMILDLGLPDMSGFDLLKILKEDGEITVPPVIVYSGQDLTMAQTNELRKYSQSIIIKSVRSEERLLDETSLFLHRMVDRMPEEKRKMISVLHDGDQVLQDRTVLIVDDDMRNVFALSKVLSTKGLNILKAENGARAVEILDQTSDVDLVLMDIMMPVMDGYETMEKIRADKRFDKLPIIALTAKAMKRDKDACIAAGANDYLAKPIEIDRLLSMMRVWLHR